MTGTKLAYAAAVLGASSPQDGSAVAPTVTPVAEKATNPRDASERSTESASAAPATALISKPQKSHMGENVVGKAEQAKPPNMKENGKGGSNDTKKSAWKKPDADVAVTKENSSKKEEPDAKESKQISTSNPNKDSRNGGNIKKKTASIKKGDSTNNATKKQYKSRQQGGSNGNSQHHQGKQRTKNNSGNKSEKGGQNASSGKKNKSRSKKNNKRQKQHVYPQPLSPAEFEHLKDAVVYQIEYFFSDDELSRNIFLRHHMDSEGYLPAALIFNFPSVAAYCFLYYDLLAVLSEKTSLLEIDQANETLRRKGNYEKWLCPNGEGGFGCPRWIKEQPQVELPTHEPSQDKADASKADDGSSGSVSTPDTDSCTDSEIMEHTDGML